MIPDAFLWECLLPGWPLQKGGRGEEDGGEGAPELSTEGDKALDISLASLPGHSTVDSKVERVGETDESIDCKDYVLGNVVVKQEESKTENYEKIIFRNTRADDCLAPAWESVEHGDDHQRNLSAEKECNNYNQHQGHFMEVSLAPTFSNQAAA